MNAYIFQAALYCGPCGIQICARLARDGKAPTDPSDEESFDSDDFPKGPFADGGGEADMPQYCDGCGLFLENPLTRDGETYVRESLAERPDNANARTWGEFYGLDPLCLQCREDSLGWAHKGRCAECVVPEAMRAAGLDGTRQVSGGADWCVPAWRVRGDLFLTQEDEPSTATPFAIVRKDSEGDVTSLGEDLSLANAIECAQSALKGRG